MRHFAAFLGIAFISLLAQTQPTQSQSDGLSPQEQRGKDIYFGVETSSERPIKALIGDPPTEVKGTLLACANCHGEDGKGRPEGGVIPSNITWESLTKPYVTARAGGEVRPGYTDRLLVRAICLGVDSGGNKLQLAMPRFQMSRDDINALVAFLKRLGKDTDPGLSDTAIRIGTLLPATGSLAEAGRAVRSVLAAYFDEINRQTGIYNRRVELIVAMAGDSPAESAANIEKLIKDERPFAIVAPLIAGAEKHVVAACERRRVPLIGPLTVFAETGYPASRHTFYLLSGIEQQARSLVDYARSNLGPSDSRLAILYSPEAVSLDIVQTIQQYCKQSGREAVITIDGRTDGFDSPSLAQRLRSAGADHLLLLASGDEAKLFAMAAEKTGWIPALLVPGSLATNGLLGLSSNFEKRIFLSLPSLPSDQTRAGVAEYQALADTHKLSRSEMASQIAALCSAKVLEQGLKLAGRTVTRERLVRALEGLHDFDTGLMPKIAFGPDRRIGALGAYIVTLDQKQLRPVSGWLRLD